METTPILQIYHNNHCSKSRECLAFLREDEQPIEIIDYLNNPPSIAQIEELLRKLGIPPIDLVRKKEAIWKEVGCDSLSDAQIIELLHQYPKLIERPILIQGEKAIIARPLSVAQQWLEEQKQ
jgi:putative arsenate reductase|nr:ArsC/Spx/MgsR family protein [uncultured Capnocytophaga sp.]